MRVLHFSLSYRSASALGGPDLTVYKLCTALSKRGVKVDVICTNLASKTSVLQAETFERTVDGVHVTYLATRKLIPLGRNSFGLYYLPELRSLLRSVAGRYDVMHFHGYRDYISVIGAEQAAAAGVPYVLHPRGTIPYQGHSVAAKTVFDRTVGRRMIRNAAALIALSDREVESYLDLGADPAKIHVVHNGMESKDYDPAASGVAFRTRHGIAEQIIILYFGRVHAIKGIDHMLRAVARLRRTGLDVAAVVVGPDEGYGATLTQIAREEQFEHLYLIPTVSGPQAKQEVFGATDVLVYAAAVEDFGVSAFEGILSGVPTIVSAGTGCGEIVASLDAGTLVHYGDVDELEQALTQILAAPQSARAYTLAARARVIAALDWDQVVAQVQRLYERICASSPHEAPLAMRQPTGFPPNG